VRGEARGESHLLLQAHGLVPLKVRQVLADVPLLPAFVPRGVLPLLLNLVLLPRLGQRARPDAARQLRDDDRGQDEVGERFGMAVRGRGLGGAVDEDLGTSASASFSNGRKGRRTRLWSMISTMAARRLA
jgi:hypothetical protein